MTNTQDIENQLERIMERMSDEILNSLKKKDERYHKICLKKGYYQVAFRNIQKANELGVELIE